MKKFALFLIISCFLPFLSFAQKDKLDALISQFPKKSTPITLTTNDLITSIDKKVEDNLAWEMLWQKNQFVKPEESECHPVAHYTLYDKIAVFIFFKGKADNLAFFVEVITFDLRKGKYIHQFSMLASFNTDGAVMCNVEQKSDGNLKGATYTTLGTRDIFNMKITNSGEVKEAK